MQDRRPFGLPALLRLLARLTGPNREGKLGMTQAGRWLTVKIIWRIIYRHSHDLPLCTSAAGTVLWVAPRFKRLMLRARLELITTEKRKTRRR